MSSVKFFPSRWRIDPNWTSVFCLGRSESGVSVTITIENLPYLTGVMVQEEVDSLLTNGTILRYTNIEPEVYRLYFLDRESIQKFQRWYTGSGRIVPENPLRQFFLSRNINPGDWQEVNNIKTPPFLGPACSDLDFYSECLKSYPSEGWSPVLNVFLVLDSGTISLTVEYGAQSQNMVFPTLTLAEMKIREFNPDRLIYYSSSFENPGAFSLRGALINWASIDPRIPRNSLELSQFWKVNGEELVKRLINFWKDDLTSHLATNWETAARDLLGSLYPRMVFGEMFKLREGLYRRGYVSDLKDLLIGTPFETYFLGTGFEEIPVSFMNLPENVIWIDSSSVVSEEPIPEINGTPQALVISGIDKILVDSSGKITRVGLGPLSTPCCNLINKMFLEMVSAVLSNGTPKNPTTEHSDFILTTTISYRSTGETHLTLISQMQELGELPVRFLRKVSYLQTTQGPIIMEIVQKDSSKYYGLIDYSWYNNLIQRILGRIF